MGGRAERWRERRLVTGPTGTVGSALLPTLVVPGAVDVGHGQEDELELRVHIVLLRDPPASRRRWSVPARTDEFCTFAVSERMQNTEELLFGRRTWQAVASAWPERAGDPFADRMNSIRKYVVSSTLWPQDLHWRNSTLLPADGLVPRVRELREQGVGDLQVMGSASLARTLISHDLVDEYQLMLEPIRLGGGKRLFAGDGRARRLELVSSATSSTGVLICTYRPARDGDPA